MKLAMPTSAIVLAAGNGMRLHPLTGTVPKGMVSVGGRPVLAHAIEHLRSYGVTSITINVHHHPDIICDFFGDGRAWGVSIHYAFEERLLGTAGAVLNVRHRLAAPFFVWYGDNISSCRLDRLFEFHRAKGGVASVALWHRPEVSASGVAELDDNDRITRFLEKPDPNRTASRWVNAGIYVLEGDALAYIPSAPSDFGRDVFPKMSAVNGRLFGYRMSVDERLWWIDTPADLARVEHEFRAR